MLGAPAAGRATKSKRRVKTSAKGAGRTVAGTQEVHMTEPWRGTRVVLETGGWWEVLPADMDHFMRHAEAYVASPNVDPAARERVREVWIERKHRPAWRKFTPRPGKVITPAGAAVDESTGEVITDAPDEDPF